MMKNLVYVINGAGGSGKDSFIDFVETYLGTSHVLNISTVDKVKEVAQKLGWNGKKTPESRKFLSDLKDMMTYWSDTPFIDVVNRTNFQINEWEEYGAKGGMVFIHCREPNEIDRLVKELDAKTILIRRNTKENYINHADNEVEDYNYDIIIDNNKALEDLRLKAITFIQKEEAEN